MAGHLGPAATVRRKVLHRAVADEAAALLGGAAAAAAAPVLAVLGRALSLLARGVLAIGLDELVDGLGPVGDELLLAKARVSARRRRLAPAALLATRGDGARGLRLAHLVGERGLDGVRGEALPQTGVGGRTGGGGAEGVAGRSSS